MYQTSKQKSAISNQQKLKIISENKSASRRTKLKELQNKINSNKKITIISAWRYPGVSPKKNPIPNEILREIEEAGIIN
jgi:hypothetical protein